MTRDTIGPGAAAVHIVCADLFLCGYRAFLAAEGLRYDVLLDTGKKLYRIQVKGTGVPRGRSSRPKSAPLYQFTTDRAHRPDRVGQKSAIKAYNQEEIDIIACVALDLRIVAYFPVVERYLSALHLYPPGTPPFMRAGVNQRRRIDGFPIADLLR